jgi:hypothetical protein
MIEPKVGVAHLRVVFLPLWSTKGAGLQGDVSSLGSLRGAVGAGVCAGAGACRLHAVPGGSGLLCPAGGGGGLNAWNRLGIPLSPP